jgi:hypothetical protein
VANRDRRNIDWEGLYERGIAPPARDDLGVYPSGRAPRNDPPSFNVQTANGTAHWQGTGWNKEFDWRQPQVSPDETRPAGRSNRTGE